MNPSIGSMQLRPFTATQGKRSETSSLKRTMKTSSAKWSTRCTDIATLTTLPNPRPPLGWERSRETRYTLGTVETAGDLDTDRYLLYGDTLSGFNSSLSDENEKVLLSLKVDGFDTDEIAQMLGVPKSKVYSDWFKLKRKLSSAA